MRLHRLSMTAFGPFADREEVDFDDLSAAGLFLLCGPTGAGKTSVLDAVCFALFGQVPGERDKAKRLRSDHATAGVGPRVVLEVTLRARRVRITRSPEWLRPKKRGAGLMREPAKILLEERVEGTWRQRTNRIDEAADLLGDLVGMTVGQFCQVALLPQGSFEKFLKAGSQERHQVLERLFDAGRFRAVEDWLAEHRKALGQESAEHAAQVTTVLARIGEVSDRGPLVGGAPIVDERALAWASDIRDSTVSALVDTRSARVGADQAVKRARADRDAARTLADLQARHRDAVNRAERVRALADDTRALRARIAAARRAEAVSPVAALHDEAMDRVRNARSAAEAAAIGVEDCVPGELAEALATLLAEPEPVAWPDEQLAEAAGSHRHEAARLAALVPTQSELDDVLAATVAVAADLVEQTTLSERAAEAVTDIETQRAALTAQLAENEFDPVAIATLEGELRLAEARVVAAEHAEQARRRHEELQARLSAATETAQAARSAWLDARQQRLDGMAAELAGILRAGSGCPVCGATTHPAPAQPAAGQVTAAEERVAEQAVHCTDALRADLASQVHDCAAELAAATASASGLDLPAAVLSRAEVSTQLEAAGSRRRMRATLVPRMAGLAGQAEEAAELGRSIDTEMTMLHERASQLAARRDRLTTTLRQAVGDSSLTGRLGSASAAARRLEALRVAVSDWREACAASASLHRRLDQAVRSQGFSSTAEARAAATAATELADHEALLAERDAEAHRVQELLAGPALHDAGQQPVPDLATIEQELQDLERSRDTVVATQSRLAGQADRLEILLSQLEAEQAAWRPVQLAHQVTSDLAALCAGLSADNPERIRLSSYVLAARLAQVVDAANERLERMSGGRYRLEHTDRRGVGDRRGGLGLLIGDAWTGESRDPATLSGGEGFIASLALALGLADVVAYEAGGTELGTLFVDEGFGSLDVDSLDEVMDVLDELRSGGRVVGLVSHVSELRSRVPTRLEIRKGRHGSTLAQQ